MEATRFHWSRAAFADAALGSALISILFGAWAYLAWPDQPWASILVGGLAVVSAAVTVGWLTATVGLSMTVDNIGVVLYGRGLFHRPRKRRDYPWGVIHRLRIEDGLGPAHRLTRRVTVVDLHIDLEPHAMSSGEHPAIQLSFFAEPTEDVVASIRRAAAAADVELRVDPDVDVPGAVRRPVRVPRRPSG